MKREGARKVQRETAGMTVEQELAYWHEGTEELRALQETRRKMKNLDLPERDLPDTFESASLAEYTGHMESEIIRAALEKFHWNKTKTAKHLGLKRTTLQYKIKKYGIE
jgi:transcriptional regulator with GAF, ATPase, and Fis domain